MTVTVAPQVELHIELVWFSGLSDIDLHYLAPPGSFFDANGPDCHYMELNPDWGQGGQGVADGNGTNDPTLDVDNIAGFGPENINQAVLYDTASPHKVGVHYYSDKGVTGPVDARIRIYVDGTMRLEKTHSLDCNELWEVASIAVSGSGTSVTVTDLGFGTTMTSEGQCSGPTAGGGGGGGCCSSSTGPGCSDSLVESCVCWFDSYCCTDAWDSTCVGEVNGYFCGSCP